MCYNCTWYNSVNIAEKFSLLWYELVSVFTWCFVSTGVPSRQQCCASDQGIHEYECACEPRECGVCAALVTFCLCLPERRRGCVPVCLCLVWALNVGATGGRALSVALWVLCVYVIHFQPHCWLTLQAGTYQFHPLDSDGDLEVTGLDTVAEEIPRTRVAGGSRCF